MTRSKVIVFAPDLHFPKHDVPTVRAMMDFICRNKIHAIVLGGDQLDNEEISRHNIGKNLYKPTGSFKRNEENFDKHFLTPLEKLVKGADKHWIIGNHCDWERQLAETQPELDGCFDRTINLRLKKRGWNIIENGKCLKVGKLAVIHGDQLSTGFGAGTYPTKRALEIYMKSVLFGHTHQAQSFAKVCPVENTQRYMAWSSPVLCKLNPTYMKNKPCAWINGFSIIEVVPSGDFNVFPIVVTKGRFSFGGKVYGNK
jgi:predicted phosphodiesterase